LFSIILHAKRTGKGVALKYLCDIDRIIRIQRSVLDYDFMFKAAETFKLKTSCFILLDIAKKLFHTPVPRKFIDNCHPCVMQSFFLRKVTYRTLFIKEITRERWTYYGYVILYFLMHDSIIFPIYYTISANRRKFSKFCDISINSKFFDVKYVFRILYIFLKIIFRIFFSIIKYIKNLY